MKYFFINILLFTGLNITVFSQDRHWVYFNERDTTDTKIQLSKTTLSQRKEQGIPLRQYSDFPVSERYIEILKEKGITIEVKSKWLNAVSVLADSTQIAAIEALHFVTEVSPVQSIKVFQNNYDKQEFASALEQINGYALRNSGYDGSEVSIGIIDGGFLDANNTDDLSFFFFYDKVKAFRNFTMDLTEAFEGRKNLQDDHGTKVWKNIGGYDRDNDVVLGLATQSDYYLAKTDRGDMEFRGEEDYWIEALEWMDSLGVRIINSSVGYNIGFDNPAENYTPKEIDGKSSVITLAAQIAAEKKGMLVVVSAGNEGNEDFKVLSVPADAKDVLSVGSTQKNIWKKMSYSSIGPENLGYPKPDMACFSLSGTSFTAPIITGLAACIMQAKPSLTNYEIMDIIKKSCHLYPFPNNYLGYGVPDGTKIISLLKNKSAKVWNSDKILSTEQSVTVSTLSANPIIVYHKKDPYNVVEETTQNPSDLSVTIKRKDSSIAFTTLYLDGRVVEIEWK